MWIWQHEQWPNFTWDNSIIDPLLRQTRLNQGEQLNVFSVRSSLANKLGLSEAQPFPTTQQTDGLAACL